LAHDHAQAAAPVFSKTDADNFDLGREIAQVFIGRRVEAEREGDEIDERLTSTAPGGQIPSGWCVAR
jgi:hypothetical protein